MDEQPHGEGMGKMKRTHIYTGTKRSIVFNVLNGHYTVEKAAFLVRVQPATVKRWLNKFGREFLTTPLDPPVQN